MGMEWQLQHCRGMSLERVRRIRRFRRFRALWQTVGLCALLLTALSACGSETAADDDDTGGDGTGRYLPLAVGASWTWRVTSSSGTTYDKVSTVEAFEDVGGAKAGVMAYRVRTQGDDGETVSWQEDTGTAVIRHREQSFTTAAALQSDQVFMPYKLRIDEATDRTSDGASFGETYTEVETDPLTGATKTQTKADTWTVEAVNESVTVPAGTFSCIRLHRVGTEAGSADKRYWFARGVGKIKESGGQTEELASFTPGAAQ
jgi:hypothetical protein